MEKSVVIFFLKNFEYSFLCSGQFLMKIVRSNRIQNSMRRIKNLVSLEYHLSRFPCWISTKLVSSQLSHKTHLKNKYSKKENILYPRTFLHENT